MQGITLSLTSLTYLVFVLILVFIYYLVKQNRQWIVLLLSSMIFFVNVSGTKSIVWILLTWMITYVGVRWMTKIRDEKKKKVFVTVLVIFVIAQLYLLKYTRGLPILAPIAISYYSLSILAYILDVYWGISEAEKNPFLYLLYVGYFPQMTSGPVNRYRDLRPQFLKGAEFDADKVKYGILRILFGVMKKCLIADQVAVMVNTIFGDTVTYQGAYVLLGAILFTLQLYTDFSGCMDIILGTSECFGITLPENFDLPFSSTTMSEFWRRWHITLGIWFKEYVMYPLLKSAPMQKLNTVCVKKYGRKKGKKIPTYLGLFVVWFLIGYWHGGDLHYIIGSGILHYCYIVGGELLEPHIDKWTKKHGIDRTKSWYVLLRRCKVFLLVNSGFIFFRSATAYQGFKMIYRMVLPVEGTFFRKPEVFSLGLNLTGILTMMLGCIVLWMVSFIKNRGINIREKICSLPFFFRYTVYILFTMLVILSMVRGYGNDVSSFIYNRF